MNNVVFYFPSRKIGGVQVLFSVLSELLSEELSVYVVDYKNGYLSKNRTDSVGLIPFDKKNKAIIPEGSVLIAQADNAINIDDFLSIPDSTKLFFWYLHPYNLKVIVPFLKKWQLINWWFIKLLSKTILNKDAKKIETVIKLAHENKALHFMDGSTYDVCENLLGCKLEEPSYAPVVNNEFNVDKDYCFTSSDNRMNICYLGRVDNDFKLEMIKKVISDLLTYNTRNNDELRLTIIGDGPGLVHLKRFSEKKKCININYISRLEKQDLVDYLSNQVDILFAMGMSAVEGAKLKIPTVCLDAAYTAVSDKYKYRWLFESKNYSLGYILRNNYIPPENTMNFNELINALKNKPDYISDKTFLFYQQYYNNKENFDNFKLKLFSTNLKYIDLKENGLNIFGVRDVIKYFKNNLMIK